MTRLDGPEGTEIRIEARARSFLHNQVRSMVGSLERVGSGAWTPSLMAEALAARDRAACGTVAPPHGLILTGVTYDPDPFAVQPIPRADTVPQLVTGKATPPAD